MLLDGMSLAHHLTKDDDLGIVCQSRLTPLRAGLTIIQAANETNLNLSQVMRFTHVLGFAFGLALSFAAIQSGSPTFFSSLNFDRLYETLASD